jgi:hypothetical protein
MEKKYKSYEDVRNSLNNIPITWYPALLIHLLEIVIDKKIFNDRYGLKKFIYKVINDKGYK